MTTQAVKAPGGTVRTADVSFRHVLASEWVKFWSLRSTLLTLLATVAIMIGIGALAAWAVDSSWDDLNAAERATFNTIDPALVPLAGAAVALRRRDA